MMQHLLDLKMSAIDFYKNEILLKPVQVLVFTQVRVYFWETKNGTHSRDFFKKNAQFICPIFRG